MNPPLTYLCVSASLCLCVASASLASPSDRLAAAQSLFASAASASDFAKAAQDFESLAQDAPNPGLHFNAGNAYFRAGDLGRAILHYRRALRLAPRYAEAQANLAAARRKRLDQAEAEALSIYERLAFWHNPLSARSKFWVLFGFWILFWGGLILSVWKTPPHLVAISVFNLVVVVLLGASLGIELWQESRHPGAVVLAAEVPLRIGGADRYDLAVEEPLHAGAEVRVVESRQGWFRVRLNPEIGGWVPAETLGLVPPSRLEN